MAEEKKEVLYRLTVMKRQVVAVQLMFAAVEQPCMCNTDILELHQMQWFLMKLKGTSEFWFAGDQMPIHSVSRGFIH